MTKSEYYIAAWVNAARLTKNEKAKPARHVNRRDPPSTVVCLISSANAPPFRRSSAARRTEAAEGIQYVSIVQQNSYWRCPAAKQCDSSTNTMILKGRLLLLLVFLLLPCAFTFTVVGGSKINEPPRLTTCTTLFAWTSHTVRARTSGAIRFETKNKGKYEIGTRIPSDRSSSRNEARETGWAHFSFRFCLIILGLNESLKKKAKHEQPKREARP